MKQYQLILRTFLLTLLLGVSSFSFANEGYGDAKPGKDLRGQIENLIKNPDLTNSNLLKEEVFLHFFINVKGEVVVLFVETENFFVDNYLKRRLNYKQLKDVSTGRYKMKVIIRNGSPARNEIQYQPNNEIPKHIRYGLMGLPTDVRKSIISKISAFKRK